MNVAKRADTGHSLRMIPMAGEGRSRPEAWPRISFPAKGTFCASPTLVSGAANDRFPPFVSAPDRMLRIA